MLLQEALTGGNSTIGDKSRMGGNVIWLEATGGNATTGGFLTIVDDATRGDCNGIKIQWNNGGQWEIEWKMIMVIFWHEKELYHFAYFNLHSLHSYILG